MFDSKLAELAIMYDVAYENIWCFNELYDNYPFPANLSDIVSLQILQSKLNFDRPTRRNRAAWRRRHCRSGSRVSGAKK